MTPLTADNAKPTAMRAAVFVLVETMGWEIAWFDMMVSFLFLMMDTVYVFMRLLSPIGG